MNTENNMIIIKGEIKTSDVKSCKYDGNINKWTVKFNNEKPYFYEFHNLEKLIKPKVLNKNMYRIKNKGVELFDIKDIRVFEGKNDKYWHICFDNGSKKDYREKELEIFESVLNEKESSNVFEYIKQIAELNEIVNDLTGEKILIKKYNNLTFLSNDVVLSKYLNPTLLKNRKSNIDYKPIFPFGCNNSQYTAVKSAMENQISVIQGPPGTGKTQTILNIIANILIQDKTVQIVSNNNSATANIYDKLSSNKYGLGFIVAILGNENNKKIFIEQQNKNYPDFSTWKIEKDLIEELQKSVPEQFIKLKEIFDKQEKLAYLKQEFSQLSTEQEYFNQYSNNSDVNFEKIKFKKNLHSNSVMKLLQECQSISENKKTIGFLFKVKSFFTCGIKDRSIYNQDISNIIIVFQYMYYYAKNNELLSEIDVLEKYLNNADGTLLDNLCEESMKILKDKLVRKYEVNDSRKIFNEDSFREESNKILEEYPVILSTTFSSTNSLNSHIIYDYLIIDEASQVDIATGALALSCAKNVVIVGDTKQLPNIVNNDVKSKANAIFDSFNLNEGYRYTKSFLQSVIDVFSDSKIPKTLLREHYRCHPKIINFCNQKFYNGDLVIMTKDKGEKDVLSVIKTAVGNHVRDNYSQRQIDVIKQEVLAKYNLDMDKTGIITPYRNQVNALHNDIENVNADTVHKFQGKEKDNIIISTVDDEITDFVDDPFLINVAVSRAKNKLILVTTGNEQNKERNITDLIDYIKYNNFEVKDSNVYSIFDYLYKQYDKKRILYLKKHKKISEYDSENLMYLLIEEIIADSRYSDLDVVCHYPLKMLIQNTALLNEEEYKYAMNPLTHLDFLIYNKIGKKPVLAIEVDGYKYHEEYTVQSSRDLLKDHLLELYDIPLLRFKTNGSKEKEIIIDMLEKIISS